MDTLSICYLTGQLGLGGAERQLYLLVRELVRRRHHVTVVSLNGQRGDYWEKPLQDLGVTFVAIPARSTRLYRLAVVIRTLRETKVSIVHSWTFSANLYAAVCGRLSSVGMRLGSERSNQVASRLAVGNVWYSLSLRGLEGLTVNSEAAAQYIRSFRPKLRVDVIRNGVEMPAEAPLPIVERLRIRAELGVPPSALVIAGIGSFVWSKNFNQLLEAAALLAVDFPRLAVVLIGDGPLRETLEDQARTLLPNHPVVFTGSIPGAARLLGAFDVICLPAVGFEGMPNVLLEAAAAGVPAVASAVGGTAEVVENGVTGFLFPEGDTTCLTQRLRHLLQDTSLRQRMGFAGRARIRSSFGVEAMTDTVEGVYQVTGRNRLPQSR